MITVEDAQAIRKVVPPSTKLVGVVVNASHQRIQSLVDQIGLDIVQLHGDEDSDFARQLSVPYIKAIRPRSQGQALADVRAYPSAQAMLLDPFTEGQYGGTGHILDSSVWPVKSSKPLILAGGLSADNVIERVSLLKPWGVDLNSGVENSPGRKKLEKVVRAVAQLRCVK